MWAKWNWSKTILSLPTWRKNLRIQKYAWQWSRGQDMGPKMCTNPLWRNVCFIYTKFRPPCLKVLIKNKFYLLTALIGESWNMLQVVLKLESVPENSHFWIARYIVRYLTTPTSWTKRSIKNHSWDRTTEILVLSLQVS